MKQFVKASSALLLFAAVSAQAESPAGASYHMVSKNSLFSEPEFHRVQLDGAAMSSISQGGDKTLTCTFVNRVIYNQENPECNTTADDSFFERECDLKTDISIIHLDESGPGIVKMKLFRSGPSIAGDQGFTIHHSQFTSLDQANGGILGIFDDNSQVTNYLYSEHMFHQVGASLGYDGSGFQDLTLELADDVLTVDRLRGVAVDGEGVVTCGLIPRN